VWCGTDELELVDDGGPKAHYPVVDGSRDYRPASGLEYGNATNTATPNAEGKWHGTDGEAEACFAITADEDPADRGQAGPPEYCQACGTDKPCPIDYANNPDLDGCTSECREACKGPDYYYPQLTEPPWSPDSTPFDEALLHSLPTWPDEDPLGAWEGKDEGPWSDESFWDTGPWSDGNDFECDVARIFNDAEALLLKKHKDYGPKNISQSPGGALNGLRVRMHDKLARLNHLVDKGQEPQVLDESLKDTLTDLANYAVIGIMVLEGTWPSE
jgi:hypothetical protein